jgi:hypothetical protein
MRWREEVTLTGYEMQWTVRYFRHMSLKWALPFDHQLPAFGPSAGIGTGTGTGTDPLNLTAGAIAYWNRKHAVWNGLVNSADGQFRSCNPAYDSPLDI